MHRFTTIMNRIPAIQANQVESEEARRQWDPRASSTVMLAPVPHVGDDGWQRLSIIVSDEEDDGWRSLSLIVSDEEEEIGSHLDAEREGFTVSTVLQTPTRVAHRIPDISSLEDEAAPQRVEIIGGKYKGSRGILVGKTDHRVVILLEDGSEHRLAPHNVRILQPSTDAVRPRNATEVWGSPTAVAETIFLPGDTVHIVAGVHRGKTATVVRQTPNRVSVQFLDDDDVKVRHLHLSSVSVVDGDDREPIASAAGSFVSSEVWQTRLRRSPREHPSSSHDYTSPEVAAPLELLHHIMGLREDSITLVAPDRFAQCQRTLAFAIFGHRVRTLKFSCRSKGLASSIPVSSVEPDGSKYELLSVKLQKPKKFEAKHSRQIQAQYVLTQAGRHSPHSLPPINLQEELERYAHFGLLTTEKVVARLELLQSTACMYKQKPVILSDLTVDDLEEIPEVSHEGCGFMPVQLVRRLFGSGVVGQRIFALQVRILAPKLGLFKGMLIVKHGIQRIQLPSSMRKVEAAAVENSDSAEANKVLLLVNGKFPSDVNALHLPKLFRDELPAESFTPKVLSDMIVRLWQDWPIPKDVIDRYVTASRETQGKGLEHTCLVGLADPTEAIPAGMVFITGIHCRQAPVQDTIFVTRFPCTEPDTDGHILPVLRDRPSSMDDATWKWISTLPFGGIIFGNPASVSEEPLPCQIANGDLDGDLYFVCWNTEIVSHCMAMRAVGVSNAVRTVAMAAAPPVMNPNWLRQGQEKMSDVQSLARINELMCQLHKHWKKQETPDYVHFGRAYKDALDIGKHGGFVFLPSHLWNALPSSLHRFLTATPR